MFFCQGMKQKVATGAELRASSPTSPTTGVLNCALHYASFLKKSIFLSFVGMKIEDVRRQLVLLLQSGRRARPFVQAAKLNLGRAPKERTRTNEQREDPSHSQTDANMITYANPCNEM